IAPGRKSAAGASAIRLADGELIWSQPLRPVSLERSEFVCMDGTVRDLRTAQIIGQRPPLNERTALLAANRTLEASLRLTKISKSKPLELIEGIFVTGEPAGSDYSAESQDGRPLWHYSPADAGWHFGRGYYRFVAPPYIYLLASRTPPYQSSDGKRFQDVPTQRFFLALDIRIGEIVQELDLGVWNGLCAINDVDAGGVILSFENRILAYHPRHYATKAGGS
ncbi:MAG TPA: hypothetical protein VMD30_05975, partial [Tepidisphaeraceae bacterium]|nr:hypothetical protein [Tepidisphaeraceae bacterium]